MTHKPDPDNLQSALRQAVDALREFAETDCYCGPRPAEPCALCVGLSVLSLETCPDCDGDGYVYSRCCAPMPRQQIECECGKNDGYITDKCGGCDGSGIRTK